MKEKITVIETLIDHVEDYVKTTLELYKLRAIKKTSAIISSIITAIFFFLVVILLLVILSIGVSIYLGEILGRMHYGFMIVAGFYAIVFIILLIIRKPVLKGNFTNMMINSFFNEEDNASN